MLAFFGILFGFIGLAFLLRHTHSVHVHHYCMGLLAPFFIVRESLFCNVMQGIFIGVAMDGFCRWGPDPLLVRMEKPKPSAPSTPSSADTALLAAEVRIPPPAAPVVLSIIALVPETPAG
jgi:hypothetical protein